MATATVSRQVIWCNQCRRAVKRRRKIARIVTLFCGHSVDARYKGRYYYCEECSMKSGHCWMCGYAVMPKGDRAT